MKRKRVRYGWNFGAAAALCAVMLLCSPATGLAFKSETHVYISQQILNDVIPDGKVTIEPFGAPIRRRIASRSRTESSVE